MTLAEARAEHRSPSRTAVLVGIAWAAVVLVVLAVGWLLTHPLTGSVGRMDDDLARWWVRQRTSGRSPVAQAGTDVGETVTGVVVLLATGAGFAWRTASWRPLVFVGLGYAGLGGLYVAATQLDHRDRPPVRILDPGLVPNHSFPSGHTGTATAIALCMAVLLVVYAGVRWQLTLPLVLLPVWTMAARLYQGAHHLTDVLTAFVAALVWLGVLAVLLFGQAGGPAGSAPGSVVRRRA